MAGRIARIVGRMPWCLACALVICGAHAGSLQVAGTLSGAQMAPPVATDARGTATAAFDPRTPLLVITLTLSGLRGDAVREVILGYGDPGIDGETLAVLFAGDGPCPLPLTRRLTSAGREDDAFSRAANAVLTGHAYLRVTTRDHPDGALRGQLGPAALAARLCGAEVEPLVGTDASALAAVRLDAGQTAALLTLEIPAPARVTAVHLHRGAPETNGPCLATLFTGDACPPALGRHVPLTPDLADALLAGQAYLDIHTRDYPDGEIRGQLEPPLPDGHDAGDSS